MTSEQLEQLLHESESPYLDFKREQYRFFGASDEDKAELLKDILAFANSWRRTDAFILIGIEEIKGERGKVHGIDTHFDDATLQQFVNSKTQRAVDFSVETFSIDGKKIDAIMIPVQRRPFYLKKDYGRLKANAVYFRRGTTTAEANPDEIAAMGEKAAEKEALEPKLHLQFAQLNYTHWMSSASVKELGPKLEFQTFRLNPNLLHNGNDRVPWFIDALKTPYVRSSNSREPSSWIEINSLLNGMMKPLRIAVTNQGPSSALNVEAHLKIKKKTGLVLFTHSQMNPFSRNPFIEEAPKETAVSYETSPNEWQISMRFERILSGHTVAIPEDFYLGTTESGRWELQGTIYGDNLSKPNLTILEVAISLND